MMSKKEAAMLGLLAVGGIGAALMISGKGEDLGFGGGGLGFGEEEPEAMTKKETVTETYTPTGMPTIEAPQGFFAMPETIKTLVSSKPSPSITAKKGGVTPYLYTGGAVKPGAFTVIPSAATGVTPYLYTGGVVKPGAFTRVGRGGGGGGGGARVGRGKTSSTTSKKGSTMPSGAKSTVRSLSRGFRGRFGGV